MRIAYLVSRKLMARKEIFNEKFFQISLAVVIAAAFGFSLHWLYVLKDQSQLNDTPIKFYDQYKNLQVDKTCPVKGKASAKSKIYHLPGDSFYERLKPTDCFETEAQAIAAGFRKSGR